MIRVAIYDDNPARRESLTMLLELSDHLCFAGAFSNCAHIEQDMELAQPDIVLMDIEMPERDGLYGVRALQAYNPEIKVIMQTVFEDADKIFQCLQGGAKGYILKNAPTAEIIQSIDSVYQGGAFMTPSVALKVMNYFQRKESGSDPMDQLTPKEQEVLSHLADGLSYKLIANKMNIATGTVNNHLKKIYEKLQVHSAGEAISLMYKHQWRP